MLKNRRHEKRRNMNTFPCRFKKGGVIMKRVLCFVLTFVMMTSVLMTTVLAVDTEGDIVVPETLTEEAQGDLAGTIIYGSESIRRLPMTETSRNLDTKSWTTLYSDNNWLNEIAKISAVIMAVLLVPYYGQHIYSNVVSFEAIRNMCFSLLSILFVCLYNGQHGSKKKWIYYWAYPLHILFFAILRC